MDVEQDVVRLQQTLEAADSASAALRLYRDAWNRWREQAKVQVTEYRQAVRKEVRRLETLGATIATLDSQLGKMDALIDMMEAPPRLPGTVGSQVTCFDTEEVLGMPPELRPIAAALQMVVQPRPISGVYFLVRGASVVYVGQSVNVMSRVTSHCADKEYDRVFFLRVPPKQLNTIEAAFIRMLRPEYNRSCPDEAPSAKDTAFVNELVEQCIETAKETVPAVDGPAPAPPTKPQPNQAA